MGRYILVLFYLIFHLGSISSVFAQNIAAKDLFVLTPAERKLFTPPYPVSWQGGYLEPPRKALWEAFDTGKPPVPLDPNAGPSDWYDPNGKGSQNHALIWVGESVLAYALAGDVKNFDIAAQNCLKLIALDRQQGHMRHEAIGGYITIWEGGIAAMALGGLYAPAGSQYGAQLLKESREWWADHIAVMRELRMPDGQMAIIGARVLHGITGEYHQENIRTSVNMQLIDPQPYNTLHPWIAALITSNGEPSKGLGGDYQVHWHTPNHVEERWVVLRAVQAGAIPKIPATHPIPKCVQNIYKWNSGNRIHVATPEVYGYPMSRWHLSWAPGEWIYVEQSHGYGEKGGKGPHYPPNPINIPATATHITGPNKLGGKGTTVLTNNSGFVSQSVPSALEVGKTASVTLVMKNTGSTTWTDSGTNPYRLGSENPQDNKTWGISRVNLPVATVAPNEQATFKFNITAPATPGTYDFQWKIVHEGKEWFGAQSNNIRISVTSPNQTDASILAINEPLANGCSTTLVPKISIKNNGQASMTDITIHYQIDNDPVKSKTFSTTGGLSPGGIITLSLALSTIQSGVHTIKTWATDPNKLPDLNLSNDTLVKTFRIVGLGRSLPYYVDFENNQTGGIPVGFTSINPDDKNGWFTFESNGNKAIALNNFSYGGAVNEPDELLTHVIDLTGVLNPILTFDLAHASKPGATTFDSLEVSVSTDCGVTFTQVWAKGGKALNTVADESNLYVPLGSQDYRNEKVDLTAFSGKKVIIKFVNWSNNGNSTLIDNLNLGASSLGINDTGQPENMKVYPNPAQESLNIDIQGYSFTGESLTLKLIDLHGRVITTRQIKNRFITVELPRVNTGLYIIEITGISTFFAQRIHIIN